MQQYLRHTFVTIDDLVSFLERAPVVASIVKTLSTCVGRDHEKSHFLLWAPARLVALLCQRLDTFHQTNY